MDYELRSLRGAPMGSVTNQQSSLISALKAANAALYEVQMLIYPLKPLDTALSTKTFKEPLVEGSMREVYGA